MRSHRLHSRTCSKDRIAGLLAAAAWTPAVILAALGLLNVSGVSAMAEEQVFWHEVTIQLDGALPTTNLKLDNKLEVYLGRRDGAWGSGEAKAKWRAWVLGCSALYDPNTPSRGDKKLHSWMDAEGTLAEVKEDGDSLHLVLQMTINPDPWVAGGVANLVLDLKRDGDRLTGAFSGTYERNREASERQGTTGPLGKFDVKGQATGMIAKEPWPGAVPGFVPLNAEEHPRMLFRQADLPALKKRMETVEGKVILGRLQAQLADGSRMGTWHGYGYGLMYQLTGDKNWADQARTFSEGVIAGKIASPRYGWFTHDGGYMRVGPSAAAVAAAYDMCYDAWPADFRQSVAKKLQERICPAFILEPNLKETDGQFNQRSNHYMLKNGGAGFCLLAIQGDPGVDEKVITRSRRILEQRLKRGLKDGFGDHGWFYEGTFCGRFPTNGALLGFLQALRVAEGKDFVSGCSEAQWLTTKWIYEVVRSGGKLECEQRGMYKNIAWASPHGDFGQGFGVLPEAHKPAVLWFYNQVADPGPEKTYDSDGVKEAVYAFINWPIGLEAKDPGPILGKVLWDRESGFMAFRSSWQGEGDVIASLYNGQAKLIGMGLSTTVTLPWDPKQTIEILEDGQVCLFHDDSRAWLADMSGLSGAPMIFIEITGLGPRDKLPLGTNVRASAPGGGNAPRVGKQTLDVGKYGVGLVTVQKDLAPQAKVADGEAGPQLQLGRRTVAVVNDKVVLGQTKP